LPIDDQLGALGRRLGIIKVDRRPAAGYPELFKNLDFGVYFLAASHYDYKPIDIPATLYYSEDSAPAAYRLKRSNEIFRAPVVEMVPGNHHSCVTTANVKFIAKGMAQTLDKLFPADIPATTPEGIASPLRQEVH
jgi:hypothetical protein